jgi:ABC-type Fe3+/spermidine/putrescine transport system ATPase subunit
VAGFIGDNNRADGRVMQLAADGLTAVLRVGGRDLRGRTHPGTLSQGGPGILCVRPEALRLDSGPGGGDAANSLSATVADLIHQGDHWRIQLVPDLMPRAANWMAKCLPGQVPDGMQIGSTVLIRFDQKDAWVLEPGE